MFWRPRLNVIESDKGFSVEILVRKGVKYTEGEKSLMIFSEILVGPAPLVVYGSRIKEWDPPRQGDTISEEKRQEIIENIRDAFRFEGYEIEIG